MSQEIPIPSPGFDDLSVNEKIDYIQLLWARIAANPDEVSVPDWHRQVVAERLESYRHAPDQGRGWSGVREDILRKIRDQSSGD